MDGKGGELAIANWCPLGPLPPGFPPPLPPIPGLPPPLPPRPAHRATLLCFVRLMTLMRDQQVVYRDEGLQPLVGAACVVCFKIVLQLTESPVVGILDERHSTSDLQVCKKPSKYLTVSLNF